jgi:hypothetical protein
MLSAIAIVFCAVISTPGATAGNVMMKISVPSEVILINNTLVLESVTAPVAGFIVVHSMLMGAPAQVIGYAALKKGNNPKVEIRLMMEPKVDDMLALMLHADTGAPGVFEFTVASDADAPLMAVGRPLMEIVRVNDLR